MLVIHGDQNSLKLFILNILKYVDAIVAIKPNVIIVIDRKQSL